MYIGIEYFALLLYRVFRKYLDVSDVKTKIQSDASTTQYTIFAPNNDAWGSDDLSLEQDIERLNEVRESYSGKQSHYCSANSKIYYPNNYCNYYYNYNY